MVKGRATNNNTDSQPAWPTQVGRSSESVTANSKEILIRLGAGEPIPGICEWAGWSREQFDAWWREECRRRVPASAGAVRVRGTGGQVRIGRDRWGIPHVQAQSDADLLFGFGYATAQDRLFQL